MQLCFHWNRNFRATILSGNFYSVGIPSLYITNILGSRRSTDQWNVRVLVSSYKGVIWTISRLERRKSETRQKRVDFSRVEVVSNFANVSPRVASSNSKNSRDISAICYSPPQFFLLRIPLHTGIVHSIEHTPPLPLNDFRDRTRDAFI